MLAVKHRRRRFTAAEDALIDAREDFTRDEKTAAKRAAGMTLQVIGEQYSMTRERVRQIVNREEQKMDEQTTPMEECRIC